MVKSKGRRSAEVFNMKYFRKIVKKSRHERKEWKKEEFVRGSGPEHSKLVWTLQFPQGCQKTAVLYS